MSDHVWYHGWWLLDSCGGLDGSLSVKNRKPSKNRPVCSIRHAKCCCWVGSEMQWVTGGGAPSGGAPRELEMAAGFPQTSDGLLRVNDPDDLLV